MLQSLFAFKNCKKMCFPPPLSLRMKMNKANLMMRRLACLKIFNFVCSFGCLLVSLLAGCFFKFDWNSLVWLSFSCLFVCLFVCLFCAAYLFVWDVVYFGFFLPRCMFFCLVGSLTYISFCYQEEDLLLTAEGKSKLLENRTRVST